MKAISLWQPWASLWLSEYKIHETRHWPYSGTGPLLVHAAKTQIALRPEYHHAELLEIIVAGFGRSWASELPTGAVLGVVELVDCRPTEQVRDEIGGKPDYWCGNFDAGRFAWRRHRYARFARPIPFTGRQGLFNVPDEMVRAQLPGWATP